MLQSFNDKFKGPFTWIVVISISIIFVLTGMSFLFSGFGNKNSTIAEVGDNKITLTEYEKYIQPDTPKEQKEIILNSIINQYLILSATQNQDIQISRITLQSYIFTNPIFKGDNGQFSNEKLQTIAKYFGGISNLEQMIIQNIQATIIPKNINETSFITDYETNELAKIYSQVKTIKYIKIDSKDLAKDIKVSYSELQNYFEDNKANYIIPQKADVDYYLISKDNFIQAEPSEKEIKTYYNSNPTLFSSYNNDTKNSIKKILQNREALNKYNSIIEGIDAKKFNDLSSQLGRPKSTTIIDDSKPTLEGVPGSEFFVNGPSKYGALPVSDSQSIVYYIKNVIPSKQQDFKEVKESIEKMYKKESSQKLAKEKAISIIDNLEKSNDSKYDFKITTTETKNNISSKFKRYIIDNDNSNYHLFNSDDESYFVYKVTKVAVNSSKKTAPVNVINSYNEAEQNYYLDILRNDIPIKINYKYLNE
ncbi:SurA N-terminal domain-containing protein [Pseudofrancisella aestuarii]|uniref:SurA N-terminal domain-containing protein n=1 Tax=Pseudofrancisella aestuarii TaxID=2670347 RepID=A0ABV9T9L3_9GAMM|nr:SurA N-terminal domain-containing protein [Pseudofrancisella aestuarii]